MHFPKPMKSWPAALAANRRWHQRAIRRGYSSEKEMWEDKLQDPYFIKLIAKEFQVSTDTILKRTGDCGLEATEEQRKWPTNKPDEIPQQGDGSCPRKWCTGTLADGKLCLTCGFKPEPQNGNGRLPDIVTIHRRGASGHRTKPFKPGFDSDAAMHNMDPCE